MGTSWSARFYAPPRHSDAEYLHAIECELESVVSQMSHWVPDSDLGRFNRAPAECWQSLPAGLFQVLDFSLKVAAQSGGAFDPTVGQVVEEWGFGPSQKKQHKPDPEVLSRLQHGRCGWQGLELDYVNRRARHKGCLSLDLSAVAKGFAVDQTGQVLTRLGVDSYLVEIGGELRAQGLKPGGQPWWVAVEPPGELHGFPEIRVALSGWSIATSGDYRRYFESDHRRWTHTIDPRSGCPVGAEIAAVSVIHKECMAADAWSTALMVLGAEHALKFAEKIDLAALVILRLVDGFEVRCSESFYKMTEIGAGN